MAAFPRSMQIAVMNRNRMERDMPEQWSQLPACRRHVYFYTLLLLGTLAIAAVSDAWRFSEESKKKARKPRPEDSAMMHQTMDVCRSEVRDLICWRHKIYYNT
jgi:hypothetical protein